MNLFCLIVQTYSSDKTLSCNRENVYLNTSILMALIIGKGKNQNAIFVIRFVLNKRRIVLKVSIRKDSNNGIN